MTTQQDTAFLAKPHGMEVPNAGAYLSTRESIPTPFSKPVRHYACVGRASDWVLVDSEPAREHPGVDLRRVLRSRLVWRGQHTLRVRNVARLKKNQKEKLK
jgi:hypothetical protein